METKVINIIQNECVMGEVITSQTVISNLSLDSLSFISIIVELEKTFNIEFDIETLDIKTWNTVGDIIEYVKKVIL
jgi:acyl carrier protein